MLAHVLVLLCGCACALSVDSDGDRALGLPYYVDAWEEFRVFVERLEKNIISLELLTGSTAPLTDPRRHHTILFNVINTEAISQSHCVRLPYDDIYYDKLEESVPEALSAVEKVVFSARSLRDKVKVKIVNINALFDQCPVGPDRTCDIFVDEQVKNHPELYKDQVDVLLTAGFAASQINAQGPLYNYIAENQDALKFVINGKDLLKDVVEGLADLYRHLNNFRAC